MNEIMEIWKMSLLLAGKNEYKCRANPDLAAELCTHNP